MKINYAAKAAATVLMAAGLALTTGGAASAQQPAAGAAAGPSGSVLAADAPSCVDLTVKRDGVYRVARIVNNCFDEERVKIVWTGPVPNSNCVSLHPGEPASSKRPFPATVSGVVSC